MLHIRNIISISSVALITTLGVVLPSIKSLQAESDKATIYVCYDVKEGRGHGIAKVSIYADNELHTPEFELTNNSPIISDARNGQCPGRKFDVLKTRTTETGTLDRKVDIEYRISVTHTPTPMSDSRYSTYTVNCPARFSRSDIVAVEFEIENDEVDRRYFREIRENIRPAGGKEVCAPPNS
ncbi:MAG: hypothetical protein AAGF93_19735 [Cyanobacteria bacterium P01_H01_bin.105]